MTTSLHRTRRPSSPVWDAPARPENKGSLDEREDWILNARCRQEDPEALFVRGAQQRKAVAICRPCPVLEQCRAEALDRREEFGVWGGLTERQRRALLRQNPHVENWGQHLATGGEPLGI
ncbi:WhiB family transcriptional regulator [Corynebacterium sp. YIM 101645]|uniref:Transcriptional regulator WhiB n=1 Tax=Corynebacterium lemuris TaxID=1859292 RepID=A0ABT2FXE0_9CORY|nr:WhiB family transcriptional regulator [Corynebacterium lemuris]MCS5479907.1 WhiB family transcriptional regulator [Corynebacterium lemuris]